MKLDGKVALVTGAARGIGAESARRLARKGARVALVGLDPDAFERNIEINLLGSWRTVRAALPHLVDRRGYALIVASVAAAAHAPAMSAYCASKAGVEAFADCLRQEVRHLGVDVGVAYFSWIATDLVAAGDEHPAFVYFRSQLRGAAGRTYPLSDAAEPSSAA